jgi:hypothetical protein
MGDTITLLGADHIDVELFETGTETPLTSIRHNTAFRLRVSLKDADDIKSGEDHADTDYTTGTVNVSVYTQGARVWDSEEEEWEYLDTELMVVDPEGDTTTVRAITLTNGVGQVDDFKVQLDPTAMVGALVFTAETSVDEEDIKSEVDDRDYKPGGRTTATIYAPTIVFDETHWASNVGAEDNIDRGESFDIKVAIEDGDGNPVTVTENTSIILALQFAAPGDALSAETITVSSGNSYKIDSYNIDGGTGSVDAQIVASRTGYIGDTSPIIPLDQANFYSEYEYYPPLIPDGGCWSTIRSNMNVNSVSGSSTTNEANAGYRMADGALEDGLYYINYLYRGVFSVSVADRTALVVTPEISTWSGNGSLHPVTFSLLYAYDEPAFYGDTLIWTQFTTFVANDPTTYGYTLSEIDCSSLIAGAGVNERVWFAVMTTSDYNDSDPGPYGPGYLPKSRIITINHSNVETS